MSSDKTNNDSKKATNTPGKNASHNDTSETSIEVNIPIKNFEKLVTAAAKQQISTEQLISEAIYTALQESSNNKE